MHDDTYVHALMSTHSLFIHITSSMFVLSQTIVNLIEITYKDKEYVLTSC
jgi:hypothetical protein